MLLGFSDSPCRFAIFTLILTNLDRNAAQQKGRPQEPMPPWMPASSRTPIWRSSTRVCNSSDNPRNRSRKSTRPSAENWNTIRRLSKEQWVFTSFISRRCSSIFFKALRCIDFSRTSFSCALLLSTRVARRMIRGTRWPSTLRPFGDSERLASMRVSSTGLWS